MEDYQPDQKIEKALEYSKMLKDIDVNYFWLQEINRPWDKDMSKRFNYWIGKSILMTLTFYEPKTDCEADILV